MFLSSLHIKKPGLKPEIKKFQRYVNYLLCDSQVSLVLLILSFVINTLEPNKPCLDMDDRIWNETGKCLEQWSTGKSSLLPVFIRTVS